MVYRLTVAVVASLAIFCHVQQAIASTPSRNEMDTARKWIEENLIPGSEQPPFSFVYDGQSSRNCLSDWKAVQSTRQLDKSRVERTITYLDATTGLSVRLVAVCYSDFPTIEWTISFKNAGSVDTPILEDIRALDIRLGRDSSGDFILHHQTGSQMDASDYQPLETVLDSKVKKQFLAKGGRPSSLYLPYFNIEGPDSGVIVAVGWPGQWSANFSRAGNDDLEIKAGQELTHFKLYPGEEVRTPLIVIQFHSGNWIESQNIWRRWMIEYNLPRPEGQLPPPLFTPCSSHQYWEMQGATEENQKLFIKRYIENGLKPDYWWMDAGWYVNGENWAKTGTWEVDNKRFPNGLRSVSDYAHSQGVKTLAWFEPERVAADTWLATNHPEWILGGANGGLLNLGNPEALKWVTEHIDGLLVEQGLDLYRQDFNMDPTPSWRANDAADRQGVTENKYVVGYLAFWDELRRRHPDMLIDSCAQGGRRNDLETLRRAVPFIRSDYLFEPVGQQCQMYGCSLWLPYNGTGVRSAAGQETEEYIFRSSMAIHVTPCWDLRRAGDPVAYNLAITPPRNIDLIRRLMFQWQQVAPNYYGDFYPLTEYSLASDAWMAWQFDRPEKGTGIVQAFRRGGSAEKSATYRLRGLYRGARYVVRNIDGGVVEEKSGAELMGEGLPISIAAAPAAVVITYEKVPTSGAQTSGRINR